LIKKYKFIRKEIKKQIDKQMAENSWQIFLLVI
jgi:hypothetical protein